MKTQLKSLIAACVIAMPVTAFAADTYEIDPAHAWVEFSINHAGWSFAQGDFTDVSGTIMFDKEDPAASSVEVSFPAATVDTNFDGRDEHIRSPDFLNVEEFPTISFSSTSIEVTGDNTGLITGDLTMLGMTKPVVLDATFNNEMALPWDASVTVAGFSATTTIDPSEFGMSKVAEFGLGPVVNVTINVEAANK